MEILKKKYNTFAKMHETISNIIDKIEKEDLLVINELERFFDLAIENK